MPRRKNAEPTAAPSEPRKRRRRKNGEPRAPPTEPTLAQEPATESTDQDPAIRQAEERLVEKYPHVNLKPGSLQPAGGRPEFGNKRTVFILCAACGRERVVATSDLFHVSRCRDCARAAKKANHKKDA
jgi:hypothetical protein